MDSKLTDRLICHPHYTRIYGVQRALILTDNWSELKGKVAVTRHSHFFKCFERRDGCDDFLSLYGFLSP